MIWTFYYLVVKEVEGWGDLEPVLITIAGLPNEKISYRIFIRSQTSNSKPVCHIVPMVQHHPKELLDAGVRGQPVGGGVLGDGTVQRGSGQAVTQLEKAGRLSGHQGPML